MAGRRPVTAAQRDAADQARRETVEQLHRQLADNVARMDDRAAWERLLRVGSRLHRYSFNNVVLLWAQNPNVTMVAGYRAWQAMGHQVRRGETALKVLGPVTRREPMLDTAGNPIRDAQGEVIIQRRLVGVKPVSVFDVSQVDPPLTPPAPVLLRGEAPPGLWDALAALVVAEGYTVERGDCGEANGTTNYATRQVRVRADVDEAQAVKTLAHELGHVLLPPVDVFLTSQCRGLAEVEAESVAYMVTQAHGLDSGQYTFNYVAGWASRAATADNSKGIDQIIAETGTRVIGAVDRILSRTQPGSLDGHLVDALAHDIGVGEPVTHERASTWETLTRSPSPAVRPRPVPPPSMAAARQPAGLTI